MHTRSTRHACIHPKLLQQTKYKHHSGRKGNKKNKQSRNMSSTGNINGPFEHQSYHLINTRSANQHTKPTRKQTTKRIRTHAQGIHQSGSNNHDTKSPVPGSVPASLRNSQCHLSKKTFQF
ncbi:hypothetical protein BGX38DRAFT_551096 [Terfezia claveryi]|nr:hypothetical protein BGX38DRAFT_551096 [Terfezia claveryi]